MLHGSKVKGGTARQVKDGTAGRVKGGPSMLPRASLIELAEGVAVERQDFVLWISTFLTSVHSIDSANNRFGADFFLALSWIDPSVISSELAQGGYLTLSAEVGKGGFDMGIRPDVFLINDVESEGICAEEYYIANKQRGRIVNNRRMRGVFSLSQDISLFPFDCHHFVIRMYFHECYIIQGRVPGIETGWWGRIKNNEWEIADKIDERCYNEVSPASDLTVRIYEIGMVGTRKHRYFLNNFGPVVNGLLTITIAVHLIDAEEFESRLNLTLVAFLTYAAFRISLSSMLPKVGYMSLMDKYILTAFMATYASGLVSIVLFYSMTIPREELRLSADTARTVDNVFMVGVIVIWLVVNIAIAIRVRMQDRDMTSKAPKDRPWDNMSSTTLNAEQAALIENKLLGSPTRLLPV
jgi:hypothetical protein